MKHSCPSGAAEMKDGRDASVCERCCRRRYLGLSLQSSFGSQAVISRETIIFTMWSLWFSLVRRMCSAEAMWLRSWFLY